MGVNFPLDETGPHISWTFVCMFRSRAKFGLPLTEVGRPFPSSSLLPPQHPRNQHSLARNSFVRSLRYHLVTMPLVLIADCSSVTAHGLRQGFDTNLVTATTDSSLIGYRDSTFSKRDWQRLIRRLRRAQDIHLQIAKVEEAKTRLEQRVQETLTAMKRYKSQNEQTEEGMKTICAQCHVRSAGFHGETIRDQSQVSLKCVLSIMQERLSNLHRLIHEKVVELQELTCQPGYLSEEEMAKLSQLCTRHIQTVRELKAFVVRPGQVDEEEDDDGGDDDSDCWSENSFIVLNEEDAKAQCEKQM